MTELSSHYFLQRNTNATVHNNTIDSWGVATTGDHTTITENEFTNFNQAVVQFGLVERGVIIEDGGPAVNATTEDNYFDAGTESESAVLGCYESDSPIIRNNTVEGLQ